MTTLPDTTDAHRRIDMSLPAIVVVPIGAFEQHGPHLPLDTDTRIANAIADAAIAQCAKVDVGIIRAPAIEISASDEHLGFPGTLSIGTEGLSQVLIALARSAGWSAGTIFVNGHGGNADAIAVASAQLARESVTHCFWNVSGYSDNDSHAGYAETSLMLHVSPDDVHLEAAQPGNTAGLRELMPVMRSGGVRAVSPNGVLGDPRDANAGEGARLFTMNVASLAALITRCQNEWGQRDATA